MTRGEIWMHVVWRGARRDSFMEDSEKTGAGERLVCIAFSGCEDRRACDSDTGGTRIRWPDVWSGYVSLYKWVLPAPPQLLYLPSGYIYYSHPPILPYKHTMVHPTSSILPLYYTRRPELCRRCLILFRFHSAVLF